MSGSRTNFPQDETEDAKARTIPTNGNPDLRGQVFRNTAANITGRGLALLFSVGATVVLARYLGSERLGEFGAIYAYLALFGWIATFGFEPVLVREISRERESASGLLHTAMVLSSFLCVGTVLVAVLVAPVAGYPGRLQTLLALAGLEYILTPLRLPAVIFQVDMRQWYGATINVVRQGVWFALIAILWLLGASLVYVIVGRVAVAALESGLLWMYARRFLEKSGKFLPERATKIFSDSFPIAITSLLSMIYLRIDQVMLHKMVSDSVLGQYVAAVKISELFEMLPAALMFSMAPILSVSVNDPERFRSYTDRAFRYFMILASGISVFLSVGAGLVVHVLYGSQFSPAAPLVSVLIWSEISIFFSAILCNVLIAKNQERLLPVPTLIGAGVNVALNLVLIPRYAAMGAAWATLVSYTVAWMVVLLFFKQARSVTWRGLQFAIPITGIALIAVKCSKFLPVPGTVRVLAAMALFAVGIWATRLIRRSDLNYAFSMLKKPVQDIPS